MKGLPSLMRTGPGDRAFRGAPIVVRFEASDVVAAIELYRLKQVSFWDALIVHAARSVGAEVLYSEDLQPGAILGGVRVVNPFAA